jgi:hypothetical protein
MAFSIVVEMLNLRLRKRRQPMRLHKGIEGPDRRGPPA